MAYMDSFWDTVAGHDLARTLTRELPRLNEEIIQYAGEFEEKADAVRFITETIEAGGRYVDMIDTDKGYLVIVERAERSRR